MNNLDALIVAAKPLIVLNGIEACAHYEIATTRTRLLIVGTHNESPSFKQSLAVARLVGWEKVEVVASEFFQVLDEDRAGGSMLDQLNRYLWFVDVCRRLRTVCRDCKQPNYLFADFGLLSRQVMLAVNAQKCIQLDEGTATLITNENNHSTSRNYFSTVRFHHRLAMLSKASRTNRSPDERFTFFPAPGEVSSKNSYQWLSNRASVKSMTSMAYFIGMGWHRSFCQFNDYLSLLKKVRADMPNRDEYVYVPHRDEKNDALSQIELIGWKVRRLELPIEIALCTGTNLPSHVAGFTSTGILNCAAVLPDSVKIYYYVIPESKLAVGARARYDQVYKYFATLPRLEARSFC